MALYLLCMRIIPNPGVYRYKIIDPSEAREIARNEKNIVSAVTHEVSAKALSKILGIEVQVNKTRINMRVGEKAIIIRPTKKIEQGKEEKVIRNPMAWEIGLLERIE